MPLPRGLPIVDHHCHLSPSGESIQAVRRFEAEGGTHLFVTTQNYSAGVPLTIDAYRDQFAETERLVGRIRAETTVTPYAVVAPYPIDLIGASQRLGVEGAVELQRSALDLAGSWVRHHRAVALGEVGRAHFPVDDPIREALERVLDHALVVARDVECPVVVHSEDLDSEGFRGLAELARRAGLRPERVVKHYARMRVDPTGRHGVGASYLARRDLVHEVLEDGGNWFLETDFLDDPRRPGAVLDLATVPRRARAIAEKSTEAAERLWNPFADSIERVYGWRPEVVRAGGG